MRTADLELAARCRAGDADAFEELYRQHARRLFSLVLRMIGSADDAEDLLQEVFLQAHRKLAGFRGESTLGTWLYRLTMNHCLDHLRGRQARMSRATESLDDDDAAEPVGAGAGRARGRSAAWTWNARSTCCRTGRGRRFSCTTWKDSSTAKSHRSSAISEGTSKSQVHKARMKLRAILSR